ncbi:reverse transcriptase domain-containing protein [Tanacetum coccineum]|uniref:Reverse transcriptase domain-containing protein n=1 Tax=Tanacetum coccineum TaxID=301880 RepID=A0ABQ5D5V7_9ASTR
MKTPTPIPNQGDCHQKPKKTSNFVEKKRANTVISIEENRQEVELIDLPPHLDTHSWKMKTCTVIIAKELSFGEKRSDQGLIYPISDSPWVSPIHCVPKKGGFTVVQNEENVVDPNSIGTGWRFRNVKEKLTEAPILIAPNWDLPFELMCDASDYAIGAVLGQRHEKHFRPIHYASKTMTEAESNYTTTEKEMLAVVYAFEKFRSYLIMNKSIVHTDHSGSQVIASTKRLLKAIIALMGSPPPRICLYVLDTKEARTSPGRSSCPDLEITLSRGLLTLQVTTRVMQKYGVTHRLSTAYHPQTSGQVEVSNRGLKRILERTIGENRASWSGQIDDALWAFRTAYLIAHRVYSLQACDYRDVLALVSRFCLFDTRASNPQLHFGNPDILIGLTKKEKGVEIKDVEDVERPRPTSTRSVLTLKPLPKIDPKAKGKGMIKEEDESDTESEDITEAEKKFKMLANDEEMARKVQEEWEAEDKKERLAEEEATKVAFTNEYDFTHARLNPDKILAEKVQEEERENFTIEERAKLLHDTIATQRRFLAQQRYEVIKNKLPSRTQLRNQMMTYLKHVGGKKHSDLKTKIFEEIQVLYEKVKRFDENFIAIGSVEDERLIKDLNKKVAGIKKTDSIKKESKEEEEEEEEGIKKRKLDTRKKMKSRKRRFRQYTSEDENDELRLCLTIAPDEDKEVDYEILDKKYPIIEWKSENLGIKPYSGQRRYISTLMRVLSVFDKDDLNVVYQLVMDRYKDEILEGFDIVLWGDLMIMFNPSDEDEFWNSQQDWNVVSWKLHGSSGVHTLMIDKGLVIHMLVEKQ